MSKTGTKPFNLLSVGHRAVGKTVFIAGSYAELHSDIHLGRTQQLWFDCQDIQQQEKIEDILKLVVKIGQYPPPTLKVTNFNLSLKRRGLWGTQTLCHFNWWDIPGEICKMHNQDFDSMVSTSHGSCVFIDAHALVYNPAYLKALEDITEQVMAIACMAGVKGLKYPFALILTKCDLLERDLLSRQQLKLGMKPLLTRLEQIGANYQTFYSFIPIVYTASGPTIKSKGAAASLLWLVLELSVAHNPILMNTLLELVTPSLLKCSQPQQAMAAQTRHSEFNPPEKPYRLSLYLQPPDYKYILLLVIIIVNVAGVIAILSQ